MQSKCHIVLQGIKYEISDMSGGLLIGKAHDEFACRQFDEGCNSRSDGLNIFVGWYCSQKCRCINNPGHMIDKHHMRIWRNKGGNICVVNNDPYRRSAINRHGLWKPMISYKKVILQNHDQVALLYNEKKGPFLKFILHV